MNPIMVGGSMAVRMVRIEDGRVLARREVFLMTDLRTTEHEFSHVTGGWAGQHVGSTTTPHASMDAAQAWIDSRERELTEAGWLRLTSTPDPD